MTGHSRRAHTFPTTNDQSAAKPTESGGYGNEYVPRAVPPNVGLRQPVPLGGTDVESQPLKYIALALIHLRRHMSTVATALEDRSRPVDEYQSQTPTGPVTNSITIQPQYETNERITSITVCGPAGNATVTLGDRVIPVVIPASQILVIAPVSMYIARDDLRQLTTATAGQINLILGGYADTRGIGP